MELSPVDKCNVSHECFCLVSAIQRGNRKKEKKGGVGEGRNTPVMIQYDDSAAKLTFGSTKL